MIGKL